MNNKLSIVYIEWLDSKGITTEWEFLEEIPDLHPALCRSTGFVFKEDAEYITVIQNLAFNPEVEDETQISGRMTIPKCAITDLRTIRTMELKTIQNSKLNTTS